MQNYFYQNVLIMKEKTSNLKLSKSQEEKLWFRNLKEEQIKERIPQTK
jgi:hypothetical protein